MRKSSSLLGLCGLVALLAAPGPASAQPWRDGFGYGRPGGWHEGWRREYREGWRHEFRDGWRRDFGPRFVYGRPRPFLFGPPVAVLAPAPVYVEPPPVYEEAPPPYYEAQPRTYRSRVVRRRLRPRAVQHVATPPCLCSGAAPSPVAVAPIAPAPSGETAPLPPATPYLPALRPAPTGSTPEPSH